MLQGEHSAIFLTFIRLPFVIKIIVWSNFEWPFYTGFTVLSKIYVVFDIMNTHDLEHTLRLYVCLIWFFTSHQQSFSYVGTGLPGWNQYTAKINVSCSRTQCSDTGEARTLVSSQVLYHWATALPTHWEQLAVYTMRFFFSVIIRVNVKIHQILKEVKRKIWIK